MLLCLALKENYHDRILNIKVTKTLKIEGQTVLTVPTSTAIKIQNIERHLETHPTKPGLPNAVKVRKEEIEKMNNSFLVKLSADPIPSYNMTEETLSFLFQFGEVGRLTNTNPLAFLNVNRKSLKKNLENMSSELFEEMKNLLQAKMSAALPINQLPLISSVSNSQQNQTITQVISITLNFDHAWATAIKSQIGCFTMSIRILDPETGQEKHPEINTFFIPVKTFKIHGKGDTTMEKNCDAIKKILEEIFKNKDLQSQIAVTGDGAIVRQGMISHLKEISKEKPYECLYCRIFTCLSHFMFLLSNHVFYYLMDDTELSYDKFFPNHKQRPGKKLFFFSTDEETEYKQFIRYYFDILKNLETPSQETNIALTDYITALQSQLLKQNVRKRKKEFASHADKEKFESQLMRDMETQLLTSSDPFEYFKKQLFGEDNGDDLEVITQRVLKVPNDPGRKSRRIINMLEKLSKVQRFADVCARSHFDNSIVIPDSNIPTYFNRNLSQYVVMMKYLIFVGDGGGNAFNCSLYRALCIITKVALNLDDEHETFFKDVLGNPFTRLVYF